jgi:nucleotide-binding universal stress UspA family protein
MVGVDGSESSDHALCFAIGLAARERCRVSGCFVSSLPVVTYPAGVIPVDYEAWVTELQKRFNDELERADVNGFFYQRTGDVVVELKRIANEQVADVIAVGRTRNPHLHVGSVPRRLLGTPRQPVLIVP